MKHIFKIGDGMTIENSTAEERKEIMKLIFEKGYPTIRNEFDYIDFEFSDCVLFMENGFGTSKKVTTPLTYTQMKALILGDTSKMPFKAACEAIKHGTHQIEKDCDNLDLLNQILHDAFGSACKSQGSAACYYKAGLYWVGNSGPNSLPIIKLSEIMPKEEKRIDIVNTDSVNQVDEFHAKFLNTLSILDKVTVNIEKIKKLQEKQEHLLKKNKELISQRDCIGRQLKIKPIEGTLQHLGNGTYQVKFDDPKVESIPTLTRKEAEEKLNVKIVD